MFHHELQYHKTLNRDIWPTDAGIDKLVGNSLMAIAMDFLAYLRSLGFDIQQSDIIDVFVHGSICNYYYDKHSDIDLCIYAHLDRFKAQLQGLKIPNILQTLIRNWGTQFKFKIKGRGIDLSLIDDTYHPCPDGRHKVGPQYSLVVNKWIHEPHQLRPDAVRKIRKLSHVRAREILHDVRHMDKKKVLFGKYMMDLQQKRTESMYNQYWQPLTVEVAAFKIVRNHGLIKKLRHKSAQQRGTRFNVK